MRVIWQCQVQSQYEVQLRSKLVFLLHTSILLCDSPVEFWNFLKFSWYKTVKIQRIKWKNRYPLLTRDVFCRHEVSLFVCGLETEDSRTESVSALQCSRKKEEVASSDNTCTLQTKSRNETTWGVNSAPQPPQQLITTQSPAIIDKIRNPTIEIYCNGIYLLFLPSDLPHRLQCHGYR